MKQEKTDSKKTKTKDLNNLVEKATEYFGHGYDVVSTGILPLDIKLKKRRIVECLDRLSHIQGTEREPQGDSRAFLHNCTSSDPLGHFAVGIRLQDRLPFPG